MTKIFLSHCHEDKETVHRLEAALEGLGFEVWLDDKLRAGEKYAERIKQAILDADCVVVCWSKHALESNRDWVIAEADLRRDVTISVLLEVMDLPLPHSAHHAVKLVGWGGDTSDPGFKLLVDSIRARAKPSQPALTSRLAMLIGVRHYSERSGLPELPAAHRNVQALKQILEEAPFGFAVTALEDPEKGDLEETLEPFFKSAGPSDTVLFYYTGHARLSDDKELSLSTTKTDLSRFYATTLALSALGEHFLNKSAAGQLLVILDACYGDAPPAAISEGLQSALGPGRSKVVVAAPAAPGLNAEGWQAQQSLFTAELLRALKSDDTDRNKDQSLTAAEVITALEEKLGAVKPELRPLHSEFNAAAANIVLRSGEPKGEELEPPPSKVQHFIDALLPQLEQGTIIPFLGAGVYGDGPLGFRAVSSALTTAAGLGATTQSDVAIATAAESFMVMQEDRATLLRELRKILLDQQAKCEPPAVHDFILQLHLPWLVVSSTYDFRLENRLAEAGRPYVLVAHVLRSSNDDEDGQKGEHDGKILVIRSKDHPDVKRDPSAAAELCLSDELVLKNDDCVIYKLLGSPFLNEIPFARERGLDTPVLTESDHVEFVSQLRSEATSIPRAIIKRFRHQRMLFLEYSLDIWHYRLIWNIFQRADVVANMTKRPFVARTATSPLEEHFWKQLNPEKVEVGPTALARWVCAAMRSIQ